MNYDLFCKQCQYIADSDKDAGQWFYDAAMRMFEARADFGELSNISDLFYYGVDKVYKSLYFRRKRIICTFYDWLYEQGEVSKEKVEYVHNLQLEDVIADQEMNRFYFASLDLVLEYIAEVGKGRQMGGEFDMLNIKTIAILAWYGFGTEEMVDIQKADLNEKESVIKHNDEATFIDQEYMSILMRFAKNDSHLGFPAGNPQKYKPSLYLMRSARQEHMTANNIWGAIKRFNYVGAEHGMALSIQCLRWCGIFRRIYDSDSGESVNALIQREFGCDKAFASAYADRYERWKQVKVDRL